MQTLFLSIIIFHESLFKPRIPHLERPAILGDCPHGLQREALIGFGFNFERDFYLTLYVCLPMLPSPLPLFYHLD